MDAEFYDGARISAGEHDSMSGQHERNSVGKERSRKCGQAFEAFKYQVFLHQGLHRKEQVESRILSNRRDDCRFLHETTTRSEVQQVQEGDYEFGLKIRIIFFWISNSDKNYMKKRIGLDNRSVLEHESLRGNYKKS